MKDVASRVTSWLPCLAQAPNNPATTCNVYFDDDDGITAASRIGAGLGMLWPGAASMRTGVDPGAGVKVLAGVWVENDGVGGMGGAMADVVPMVASG